MKSFLSKILITIKFGQLVQGTVQQKLKEILTENRKRIEEGEKKRRNRQRRTELESWSEKGSGKEKGSWDVEKEKKVEREEALRCKARFSRNDEVENLLRRLAIYILLKGLLSWYYT
jgi:hypothetical protein